MGSHESGMKHTEATGETRSGSEKPQATEGVDARAAEVPLSPRDRRVPYGAYEAG
jgi:hypothetical protein